MIMRAECQDCKFKRHGIEFIDGKLKENNIPFYQVCTHLERHRNHVIWFISGRVEIIDGFPVDKSKKEYRVDIRRIEEEH